MLQIKIPASEFYDERTESFIIMQENTLNLEHSLFSISKWQSKWHKPFLSDTNKTTEEFIDYIRCMTISNKQIDPSIYQAIPQAEWNRISEYIKDPMTATWFSKRGRKSRSRDVITSELVYYWMISLDIPLECDKWHFNRLMTLIRICNEKNDPKAGKMKKKDIMKQNSALNAARKAKSGTKG